jgi:hypothetical protein
MMPASERYVGIQNDHNGGLTDTGKIIRDAWVFGIIPESETCEGWVTEGIEGLRQKTNAEWSKHGFLVSNLPQELRERFMRIHDDAVTGASERVNQHDNDSARK